MQSGQDVDELVMGMASQITEREDNIVVEDFKGCLISDSHVVCDTRVFIFFCAVFQSDYMYGPLRFSRSDAVALTIQRGRDFGLPSYNQVRESFNIRPVSTWEDINPKLKDTQVLTC